MTCELPDLRTGRSYATEKAKVSFPESLTPEDLVKVVENTGYTAELPAPPRADESAGHVEEDPTRALRQRLITSVVLAVPVVVWAAWPFHQAAWTNLRHGAATMDTLISLGVGAAFLWSLYALFLGTAGVPGMTHGFDFTVQRTSGAGNIYLEVAAGVTTFILAGRYFEVRSKRRAGAALRALLEPGAKDVAVLRVPADRLTRWSGSHISELAHHFRS